MIPLKEQKEFKNSLEVRAVMAQLQREYRAKKKQKVREAQAAKHEATLTPANTRGES